MVAVPTHHTPLTAPERGPVQPLSWGNGSSASLLGARARRLVITLGVLSTIAALVSIIWGSKLSETEHPRDSYGSSVLGHEAMVLSMRAFGVRTYRWTRGDPTSVSAPLFFLEPDGVLVRRGSRTLELEIILMERARRGLATVVAIPKWALAGEPNGNRLRRDGETRDLADVLTRIGFNLNFVHVGVPNAEFRGVTVSASGRNLSVEVPHPRLFQGGQENNRNILLAESSDPPGAFLVRHPDWPIYLISDPDLIHTFAWQRGGNAELIHWLVADRLHTNAIVIDEMFHGHEESKSLTELLGTYPGFLLLIHLGAVLVIAFLTGTARPSTTQPAESVQSGERGPGASIRVAGEVMASGSPPVFLVREYVGRLLMNLLHEMKAGQGLFSPNLHHAESAAEELDRIAVRRGLKPMAVILLKESMSGSVPDPMALAQRVHRYRGHLLDSLRGAQRIDQNKQGTQ